jgi:enamine deaminase RidA (YjgF/YER057c/UK114 family)
MFRLRARRPIAVAISVLFLSACSNATTTPELENIQPAENKMVVLPQNMRLGSAVIHPPRAKDGFGDMETQTVGAFNGLHTLLKKQNLNLGNVMRVRAVLAPDANGFVDYDGYMAGFSKFFGTQKLPNEPINVMSAAATLPVTGQQLLIEADIAVPQKSEPTSPEQKEEK